jgi:hypothetical protein
MWPKFYFLIIKFLESIYVHARFWGFYLPERSNYLVWKTSFSISYNEDGHAKKPSDGQNSQVVVSTQPPLNLFLNKIIFVHMDHNMIIY